MSDPVVDRPTDFSKPAIVSPREVSGAKVIVGMFLFALLMSCCLWVYWYLHTGPFLPLQRAIFRA